MAKRDRSVADLVYRDIKEQIVRLALRPGARLDDIALADQLSFSRTPVREALIRLSSEGLVTTGERGGFMVRSLDIIDINQLFEAHILVARAVARLTATRITDGELEQLRACNAAVDAGVRDGDAYRIASSNAELHRQEAAFARNQHLLGLAWSIHDQGERLAYLCFGGERPDRGADLAAHYARTCADHAAALEAYDRRDADAAEEIAAGHVHLFRDRVVQFLRASDTDSLRLASDLPARPLLDPQPQR
jgi:DNA-binding GntR family transcriptional regulator